MKPDTITRTSLIASVFSALGATACCVAPLVLVSLGLSGAWVASLRAMEKYQPVFAVLTFAMLAVAFYYLYIQPKRCKPGDMCASPAVIRKQRIFFWIVVVAVVLIGVFYAAVPLME